MSIMEVGELIKAVESLLGDIEAMRYDSSYDEGRYTFGDFVESFQVLEDGGLTIDWPNLAISADKVHAALKEVKETAATPKRVEGGWV